MKFECNNKYFFETYCCVVYISETKLLQSCIYWKISRKHYKSDCSGQSVLTILKSLATFLVDLTLNHDVDHAVPNTRQLTWYRRLVRLYQVRGSMLGSLLRPLRNFLFLRSTPITRQIITYFDNLRCGHNKTL